MQSKMFIAGAIALATATTGQAARDVAPRAANTLAVPASVPMIVTEQAPQNVTVLPANTEIGLAMNETITTKGRRWTEGDTFDLTVTQNVMLGSHVVIPRGSRGVGRISFLTSKGAFGKSGKMEIDLEYVEVSGRRIPVTGHYRQEGEGNTVGTVAGVIAVGVFAGFVTGKSSAIPQGRELVAHTREDLPVAFADAAPAMEALPLSVRSENLPAYSPTPASRPGSQPETARKAATSAPAPVVINDFAAPAHR